MERLYVGMRVLGQRDRVRTEIVQAIQALRVGLQIPVIKLERPQSRRGARREFYIFLGTDVAQGQELRLVVEVVFQRANLSGQLFWGIREQELGSMFVGEVDVTVVGGLRDIYEPRWHQVGDGPVLSERVPAQDNWCGESLGFDRLLAWLSVRGEGTWPTFVHAANVLGIGANNPGQLRRRYSLLDHIDWEGEDRQWRVTPPTLVRSVADPNRYFLCGRRTQRWLERLTCRVQLRVIPQAGSPSRVEVCGIVAGDVAMLLKDDGMIHVDEGGAHQLAAGLPASIAEFKALLEEVPRLIPAFLRFQYWDGRAFIEPPERVYEENVGIYHGRPGMYRVTRNQEGDDHALTLFLDKSDTRHRWLRGDWYGLRFLSLSHDLAVQGLRPMARWESTVQTLAVPVDHRWPALYERALVLATGTLPVQSDDREWLLYTGVPASLWDLLATKLGIDVQTEVPHGQ